MVRGDLGRQRLARSYALGCGLRQRRRSRRLLSGNPRHRGPLGPAGEHRDQHGNRPQEEPAAEGITAGEALAAQIAANPGVSASELTTEISVPGDAAGDLLRGAEVTASVTVEIRMPALPLPGTGWSIDRTITHRERIDDYRSLR